jgi:hypothetical protein
MTGCRARIRTWARGSKVPCATTTQLGILFFTSVLFRWCRRSDSNRHGGHPPTVFETAASTHSATSAGAEDRIRTRDPLPGNEMLCQFWLVPRRRFELLRAYAHHPLKMACLPIPPPRHWNPFLQGNLLSIVNASRYGLSLTWQEWEDSNPRPAVLETAALPN